MAIEYLGLSNINGPLVVLEGLQDAFYDEIDLFSQSFFFFSCGMRKSAPAIAAGASLLSLFY